MSDEIIRFDDALFGSAVIERCRRRESSVEEALMEMCLAGVSTRGVDDISRLLWGERMPSRTLSDKLKKIYKEIDGWRKRPLESECPYVFVDGVWRKRSWGRARGERGRPRRQRRQQPPDLVSARLRNGSCPHRTRFCGARTSHT